MAGILERIQTGRMGVPIPNPERSGSGFGIGTQTARRVAPICTSFAKEGSSPSTSLRVCEVEGTARDTKWPGCDGYGRVRASQ